MVSTQVNAVNELGLVVSEALRIARERILAQTSKPISAIKRLKGGST